MFVNGNAPQGQPSPIRFPEPNIRFGSFVFPAPPAYPYNNNIVMPYGASTTRTTQAPQETKAARLSEASFGVRLPKLNIEQVWSNGDSVPETPCKDSQLKVMSFNVGTAYDWKHLYIREKLKKDKGWQLTLGNIQEILEKYKTFEESSTLTQEELLLYQKKKSESYLGKLKTYFDPDIICLQEYYDNERRTHDSIRDFLQANGYTILGRHDTAVAFKRDSFTIIQNGQTFYPKAEFFLKSNLRVNAPYFVDILHKESSTIIRVVSDHVRGFNIALQKEILEADLTGGRFSENFPERIQQFVQNIGKNPTTEGDISLDISLHNLECDSSIQPHLVIYGLDANASVVAESSERSAHPERMELFRLRGYLSTNGQTPTLLDGNDLSERSYDTICAKSRLKGYTVELTPVQHKKINKPELLHRPEKTSSDHLPVMNIIDFRGCL